VLTGIFFLFLAFCVANYTCEKCLDNQACKYAATLDKGISLCIQVGSKPGPGDWDIFFPEDKCPEKPSPIEIETSGVWICIIVTST